MHHVGVCAVQHGRCQKERALSALVQIGHHLGHRVLLAGECAVSGCAPGNEVAARRLLPCLHDELDIGRNIANGPFVVQKLKRREGNGHWDAVYSQVSAQYLTGRRALDRHAISAVHWRELGDARR